MYEERKDLLGRNPEHVRPEQNCESDDGHSEKSYLAILPDEMIGERFHDISVMQANVLPIDLRFRSFRHLRYRPHLRLNVIVSLDKITQGRQRGLGFVQLSLERVSCGLDLRGAVDGGCRWRV